MNSVLLYPTERVDEAHFVVLGERARAVCSDHALQIGIEVKGSVLGEGRGRCRVLSLAPERIEFEVTLDVPIADRSGVHLIVGVPRPQTVKKVLHAATTGGVNSVHFVRSEKGERSYLQSRALERIEVDRHMHKGMEQAFDCVPPIVTVHERFRPFVEDFLPTLSDGGARIVAHTAAGPALSSCEPLMQNPQREVVLAVGGEAGWSEFEVSLFQQQRFQPISLGERILRVEEAVLVLLGQVALLRTISRCS